MTWTAGDILSGNGSVITNAAGGTFDIQGDVALQFSLGGAMPAFVNSGGLVRSVGTGVVSLGANVNNAGAGTIDVQTGTLALTGTYTQGLSAVLMGAGTFDVPGDVITSGAINMAAGTLELGGVLNPTGTFAVGTMVFTGAGPQIVPLALSPYNNVEVTGAAVQPDGSMTFNGTFVVSGTGVFDLTPLVSGTVTVVGDVSIIDNATINVGGLGRILQANSNMMVANNADLYVGLGGGVNVVGNFNTQDLAMVRMISPGDELNVTGNVTFGGGSNAGMLVGGTVSIGGDFTQSGDPQSYATSVGHSTVFTGSTLQTINFANPTTSMFWNMSTLGADIALVTDVAVRGNMFISDPGSINGAGMKLTVGGNLTTGLGATVTLGTLEIGGVLTVPGTYTVTNTVFTGSGPQNIPDLVYNNVEVTGSNVQFSQGFGSQTVGGDLVVSGNGFLNTEMTDVTVGGNFRTQDNGVLMMMYDSSYDILRVTGDVEFGGGSTAGLLTEGEMYIGGNFTQLGTNSPESFHSGGGFFFDVYFEDTPTRTIFFETPGIGIGQPFSHFEDVGFLTNGTVTMNSNLFAHANISSSASWSPTLVGNGNKFAVGGVSVDGMVLDHVLFEANGTPNFPSNGSFVRFDNVSFVNYNPGDTQFTIIDPGGVSPYTLNNLTFGTTPTTGFYMDVTDSDLVGDVLTIQMSNPTPIDPMTFVLTSGGAVVIWPWP